MPLIRTKHWFIPLAFTPPCPIKAKPIPLKLIMLNCVTTWLGVLAVFPVPFTLFGARLNSLSLPGTVANSLNMNSQKCSLMSAILYTLDRCHSHNWQSSLIGVTPLCILSYLVPGYRVKSLLPTGHF